MRVLTLSCLVLTLVSCQASDQLVAVELRAARASIDDLAGPLGTEEFIDRPGGGGVSVMTMPIQGADLPIGFELGIDVGTQTHERDLIDNDLWAANAWLGARYEFLDDHLRPYIGGGLVVARDEVHVATSPDSTLSDWGLYLEVGLRLRVDRRFHVGIGVRRTFELEDEIAGQEIDLDYDQAFISAGLAF